MAWGAYAVSDDVNIPARNLLVESGHARLSNYARLQASNLRGLLWFLVNSERRGHVDDACI